MKVYIVIGGNFEAERPILGFLDLEKAKAFQAACDKHRLAYPSNNCLFAPGYEKEEKAYRDGQIATWLETAPSPEHAYDDYFGLLEVEVIGVK